MSFPKKLDTFKFLSAFFNQNISFGVGDVIISLIAVSPITSLVSYKLAVVSL